MAQTSSQSSDLNGPLHDARKEAAEVAGVVSEAARDVYGQACESGARVVDAAGNAAQRTMGSLEKAIRHTIEHQPYTAIAIAFGLGWLFGRLHRPL
jgi:ElaB/YqjD/DUF883 family membrane-anchored ribosome-binding protein